MVKVTIVQEERKEYFSKEENKIKPYTDTEKITGTFDDPVKAMPFLSELLDHFKCSSIIIEPVEVETDELIEEEEG